MRLAIIAISIFLSLPVFSKEIVLNVPGDLSNKDLAELQSQANTVYARNAAKPENQAPVEAPKKTVDTVKEWASIGSQIGAGLAASARELGLAANDFAKSPVGKLTMFIIIWRYVGHAIVSDIFGFVWLITLIPIWIYLYRRTHYITTTTVYEKGAGPDGATKIVIREPTTCTAAQVGYSVVLWCTFFFISLVGIISIVS